MTTPSTRFGGVSAYSPILRVVAALLLAIPVVVVLDLAGGMLLDLLAPGELERVPLPLMTRRLVYAVFMPWLAFLILRWLARATVDVGAETVTITSGRARWEIPRASIAAVTPWRLPWPSHGVAIQLRSARFGRGLAMPDPTPLVAVLGGRTEDPRLIAARARRATRWLRHPLHALVLAPLVPTAILFRLHEIIVAGGWLGEYHMFGLARWLNTLLGVWLWVAGHMLCWFAVWRLAVALLAWPAAHLGEAPARAVRWSLEVLALLGYYGGVAWLLWSRLGA